MTALNVFRLAEAGIQDTVPGVVLKKTFNIAELMPKLEKLQIAPILEENRWEVYLKNSLAIDTTASEFVPEDLEVPAEEQSQTDNAEASSGESNSTSHIEEQSTKAAQQQQAQASS